MIVNIFVTLLRALSIFWTQEIYEDRKVVEVTGVTDKI